MNKEHTNNAVVRDPGTIFISWNTQAILNNNLPNKNSDTRRQISHWIIWVKNATSGNTEKITVDPASGKFYLHSLQPDTYYNIRLCFIEFQGRINTYHDFGTLHTPVAKISSLSDQNSKWHISEDDFIRIHSPEKSHLGSS